MTKQYSAPYVNFGGRAREALEFYQNVLGGELRLYAWGKSEQAGPEDRISYGRLDLDGTPLLVASDGHPSYPPTVGDNMAVTLGGADKAKMAGIFERLAEGGQVKGPLSAQPWGSEFGYLLDRFGVNWVVSVDPS